MEAFANRLRRLAMVLLLGSGVWQAKATMAQPSPAYRFRSLVSSNIEVVDVITDQSGNAWVMGRYHDRATLPDGTVLRVDSVDLFRTASILLCFSPSGVFKRYRAFPYSIITGGFTRFMPNPGSANLKAEVYSLYWLTYGDPAFRFSCNQDSIYNGYGGWVEFDTLFHPVDCYQNTAGRTAYASSHLVTYQLLGKVGDFTEVNGLTACHGFYQFAGYRLEDSVLVNPDSALPNSVGYAALLGPRAGTAARQVRWIGQPRSHEPGYPYATYGAGVDATCLDSAGNTYIAGHFAGQRLYFRGGTLERAYRDSNGLHANGSDLFLAKVSPQGSLRWLRRIGGRGDYGIRALRLSPRQDRLYLAGGMSDTLEIGSVSYRCFANHESFVAYLDTAGTPRSVFRIRSTADGAFLTSVAQDKSGSLYLGGTIDAEGFVGSQYYRYINYGGFVAKLDTGLHLIWSKASDPAPVIRPFVHLNSLHASPVTGDVLMAGTSHFDFMLDGIRVPYASGSNDPGWLASLADAAPIDSSYLVADQRETLIQAVRLYPNPTSGRLYLTPSQWDKYTITDLSGRVLTKGLLLDRPIDCASLKTGMYLIQLFRGKEMAVARFIKE